MDDHEDQQQQQAIRMLEEHGPTLAAEAREIIVQHPGAKMVGMILSPDSSEAARFRELASASGQTVPETSGIVIVVPRKDALSILRASAPATLDWLESEPDSLPLIAATKDGMRLGSVRLEE
jgi:hypothetical protein